MNILVSDNFGLQNLLIKRWPNAHFDQVNDLATLVKQMAIVDYKLLILDVDLFENEVLVELLSNIIMFKKVIVYTSKCKNYALISTLLLRGTHGYLSTSFSEIENINIVEYVLN